MRDSTLNEQEQKHLKQIGTLYEQEKDVRKKSEIFIYCTIVIILVKSFLEIFLRNLTLEPILSILSIIMLFVALTGMWLEKKAQTYRNIADSGRRAVFYKNLIQPQLTEETFRIVGLKSKDIVPTRKDYRNWYVSTSSDIVQRKILNFYETVFHQHNLMFRYKRDYKIKYIGIWTALLILSVIGLLFGDRNFNRFTFLALTIITLSPFTIQTIFLIFDWQRQTDRVGKILTELKRISKPDELYYLFLEYTIIVRNFPSIPDNFFNKLKSEIEAEYSKIKNEIEKQVEKNFID